MFGLEGASARSPMDEMRYSSKIGVHVVPLLVVFQMTPPARPRYKVEGLTSSTVLSTILPPMFAGLIERQTNDFSRGSFDSLIGGGNSGTGCCCCCCC